MSIDYTPSIENLFQGLDIIISKRLEDVSYDTTLICTVTDDTDRKNGAYKVTNGAVTFDAYSESADYRAGESVRVQVLNGDYSEKKYIVGRAVTNTETTPLTYVSPLDTVVNITGNLVSGKELTVGLTANGDEKEINLWSADVSDKEIWTDGIYSALTVRADFRTLLDNYDLRDGSYGLRVHLYIRPSKESSHLFDNYFDLDSSEMFGNPYAFTVYTKQAKKVELSTSGIIYGVSLSAYQNANFVNRSGNLISAANHTNIFIKNIEIGFGSDLEKIEDNTVKIYTNSDPQYKYYEPTEATNQKTLGLLWYNKNDNNEYLGFSDGIYDPEYDEIEYLEAAAEDTRLAAYMAREGIPSDPESLDLAANIDEAMPIFTAARKLITSDLISQLRSYQNQISDAISDDDVKTTLKSYTTTGTSNTLTTLAQKITTNEESLELMYTSILNYWYQKSEGASSEELATLEKEIELKNYYSNIKKQYTSSVKEAVITLLDSIRAKVPNGYYGTCDNYEARINRVLNSITNTLDTIPLDGDYKILKEYKSKENFKPYERVDFSDKANKYCIYWYRVNKEAEADDIMTSGWERIEEFDNFGIPSFGEPADSENRTFYNDVSLPSGENTKEYTMQYDLAEEKFVAIVFFNHNKFVSDELVFTNADDVPDKLTLDASDALVISHEDNSRDNYNCYAMTNYLLNAADSSVEREVRCHYDGLLAGDETLVEGQVYWYVPESSTMITVRDNLLSTKGFVKAENRKKNNYICYYKKITAKKNDDGTYNYVDDNGVDSRSFWYRIKPYYSQSAALNDIQCEVILANTNEEDYIAGQLNLSFGQQSTSGTKYTMVIAPAGERRSTRTYAELSETNEDDGSYVMSLHLEDAEQNLVEITMDNASESGGAYNLTVDKKFALRRSNSEAERAIPALKEPSGDSLEWQLTATGDNYGIYTVEATIGIVSESKEETKTRNVDLKAWFSVPWSAGDYYIEGPISIMYNNLGTLDSTQAYQSPYRLFNIGTNIEEPVTWSLQYWKYDGTTATNITDSKEDGEKNYSFERSYMPVLNGDNTITPSPMYVEDVDCYPVLVATGAAGGGHKGVVLWRQPIIILQNQYASTMLNEWDGSFQLDEDNGTIMSTMIGAGRKTTKNTFEGVVMGCVSQELEIDELNKYSGGVGIYGFNDGAASFGVLVDGTAFMGKAGHGRIMFDGNKGTIESASYTQTKFYTKEDGTRLYENPAGMQIDLDDGRLTMRSASLGAEGEWVAASIGPENESDGSELNSVNSRYSATITMDADIENDSYLDITVPWWNKSKSKWVLKPLIHIGDTVKSGEINHSYYLQSQNYVASKYNWADGQKPSNDGAGMKVNLVEGVIDAFKLSVQSKNIMLNSNGDEDRPYFVVKNDEGKNLIYCGKNSSKKDEFYLQSQDYAEATGSDPGTGMKIDLEESTITAYDFTLWSKDIYISSGGDDGGIIAFTGENGKYSLSITNDPSETPINVNNVFKVGWDGSITTPNFSVDASGALKATSGTIGGWSIGTNEIYKGNMHLYSSGTNGYLEAGYCKISSDGYLSATNIKAYGRLEVTENAEVYIAGPLGVNIEPDDKYDLYVSGSSKILGNVYMGNSSAARIYAVDAKNDNCIYFDKNQIYIAGRTTSLAAEKIWIGKEPGNGNDIDSTTTIKGALNVKANTNITGNLTIEQGEGTDIRFTVNGRSKFTNDVTIDTNIYYEKGIYCKQGQNWRPGVTGTIYYFGEPERWYQSKKLKKANFVNGILIEADSEEEVVETTGNPFSDLGVSGTFLQSTGTGTQWTELYATPTTAGVAGYLLKSNGDGNNPTWTSIFDVLAPSSNDDGKFLQAKNQGSASSKALVWTSLTDAMPKATASVYGIVKVAGTNTSAITTTQGSTSGRYYGVCSDSNGKLYVNVPWTDTVSNGVPSCTTNDNEKCLMVVKGTPTWRASGHTHTVSLTLYYDSNGIYNSSGTGRTAVTITGTATRSTVY